MYVTRPLSMYRRDPSALSLPPPEGPNSGILVINDNEEVITTCCFGFCQCGSYQVRDLPFPQNKNLEVEHTSQSGEHKSTSTNSVIFIPVLNQPLSSNQYYCIELHGKHKGEAYKNAKEEDVKTCCFCCSFVPEVKPQPLDPKNIYQQFEIQHWGWGFVAKSVASDGYPPNFLSRTGWELQTSISPEIELNEAPGLNKTLRAHLPGFNFPLSQKISTPVVVGKWYCPFMFMKDESLKDQVNKSRYYEMTLEQEWKQIFACENSYKNGGNSVSVDVFVEREVAKIAGIEAESTVADGVMWFRSSVSNMGLNLAIVERMQWEQERFGWVSGSERQVRVKRLEEFTGIGEWKKFGCYVLVERFVLKRMDGSLVLNYEFRHTKQLRNKWE